MYNTNTESGDETTAYADAIRFTRYFQWVIVPTSEWSLNEASETWGHDYVTSKHYLIHLFQEEVMN